MEKKTQMHIEKTERFANIEFRLISFQFNARKPKDPDEREILSNKKKLGKKKIPLIYQPYTVKIWFTDRSTSCVTFAAAAV